MKKSSKVLIIILSVLAVLSVTAVGILYHFYPDGVTYYAKTAWDWLNQPLPVVGISVLFILVFMFKIFAESSLGKKKLNEFKRATDNIKQDFDELVQLFYELKSGCEEEINELKQENKELKQVIKEICEVIPNKKVKAIGEKYYGERKERIDNETKAD